MAYDRGLGDHPLHVVQAIAQHRQPGADHQRDHRRAQDDDGDLGVIGHGDGEGGDHGRREGQRAGHQPEQLPPGLSLGATPGAHQQHDRGEEARGEGVDGHGSQELRRPADGRDGQRAGELLARPVEWGGPQQGHDLEHDPGDHGDGGEPPGHPPARSGWGVQQHQREEDEPPDQARVTQGREELPRRYVAFAEATELGVVVAERAPGHRGPKPQERPSGRLVGRAAGHHHADQPAGDHGRDHQDVGEPGRRPDAVRAREVRGERGHHQRRRQRPGDHPRQDAPRRLHVAIVAAERLAVLRVSPDSRTGGCPVVPDLPRRRRWRPSIGNRPRSTSCLSPKPPHAPGHVAPSAMATKVAAVAAALLAVSLFMTVAVIDVPHDPSDQELLTWWQDSGEPLGGRDVGGVGPRCRGHDPRGHEPPPAPRRGHPVAAVAVVRPVDGRGRHRGLAGHGCRPRHPRAPRRHDERAAAGSRRAALLDRDELHPARAVGHGRARAVHPRGLGRRPAHGACSVAGSGTSVARARRSCSPPWSPSTAPSPRRSRSCGRCAWQWRSGASRPPTRPRYQDDAATVTPQARAPARDADGSSVGVMHEWRSARADRIHSE